MPLLSTAAAAPHGANAARCILTHSERLCLSTGVQIGRLEADMLTWLLARPPCAAPHGANASRPTYISAATSSEPPTSLQPRLCVQIGVW